MKIVIRLAVMAAMATSAFGTQIRDVLYKPDGTFETGTIEITGQKKDSSGKTFMLSTISITLVKGAVNFTLEPDNEYTWHTARYHLSKTDYQETWIVPNSPTALRIPQLWGTAPAPTTIINLLQLSASGANEGDCIKLQGGLWKAVSCGGGAPTWDSATQTWAATTSTWNSM